MSNTPQHAPSKRKPDCVTEVRVGNTALIVKGYFKQDATETAAEKMEKVIAAEGALHDIHRVAE